MSKIEERIASYENYKAIRESKGILHDSEVASKSGIDRCVFTNWKVGRSKPKIDKLVLIARALKVNVQKLI